VKLTFTRKTIFIFAICCFLQIQATYVLATKQISIKEKERTRESKPYKHYILGQLYEKEQNLEKAKSEYLKALKMDESSLALNTTMGRICIKLSQWDEAEEYLRKSKELYPQSTKPRYLLALVYTHQEKFALVIEEYLSILEIEPNDLTALSFLADLYVIENKFDNAIEVYKKIAELEPEIAIVHFNLGIIYSKLEDSPGHQLLA